MTIKYQLTKPDEVEATLSITMTIAEWKRLNEHLTSSYPDWQIGAAIRAQITQAEKHFESKATSPLQ